MMAREKALKGQSMRKGGGSPKEDLQIGNELVCSLSRIPYCQRRQWRAGRGRVNLGTGGTYPSLSFMFIFGTAGPPPAGFCVVDASVLKCIETLKR